MTARVGPLWLQQKERGSALLTAIGVRVVLLVGRRLGAALLYPVCAYFLVFSTAARRASADYLRRVLGRGPTWRERFRHYHTFASTILDRVFLHAGADTAITSGIEGLDLLRPHLAARRGCLLMGAHFGSFDVLRGIGLAESPVPVRVLMHEGHAEKLDRVLRRLNRHLPAQVIALGTPQTMLAVRDALDRGELVALLADRSLRDDREVECAFLGATAGFPRGPFQLAGLLDAPVVLFSATHRAGGRYDVRFDTLPAGTTEARARAFAAWLEGRCRASPYNWFNFYDFWAASRARGSP
jgi:predicted LPLAT superfamily acyltransferase